MRFGRVLAATAAAVVAAAGLLPPASAGEPAAASVHVVLTGKALYPDGKPVARVSVLNLPSSTYVSLLERGSIASTVPDASGRYRFELDVEKGTRLVVRARTTSHDAGKYHDVYVGSGTAAKATYLLVDPIVAAEGERALATARLQRTGTVTLTTSVPVQCGILQRVNGEELSKQCVQTPRRTFTFRGLASGRYSLTARWDSRVMSTQRLTVKVRSGETTKANLEMEPSRSITGVVRNGSGNPLRGVAVWGYDTTGSGSLLRGVTDANGRYRFRGLTSGTYVVDYSGASGTSDAVRKYATVTTTVKAGGAGTTVKLNRTMALGGSVRATITPSSSETNVYLRVFDATGAYVAESSGWAESGAAPTVVVRGLKPGSYSAVVQNDSGTWLRRSFVVAAGKVSTLGSLKPTQAPATLTGKVAGSGKRDISLEYAKGVGWAGGAQVGWGASTYTISGLVPGTYVAQVRASTGSGDYEGKRVTVTVGTGTTTVDLAKATTVVRTRSEVTTRFSFRGTPIQGVAVGRRGDEFWHCGFSSSTGRGCTLWPGQGWSKSVVHTQYFFEWSTPYYFPVKSPTTIRSASDLRSVTLGEVAGGL